MTGLHASVFGKGVNAFQLSRFKRQEERKNGHKVTGSLWMFKRAPVACDVARSLTNMDVETIPALHSVQL